MVPCSHYLIWAEGKNNMKKVCFFLLYVVSCVFAKTWSRYTSIGIEPFAKDSIWILLRWTNKEDFLINEICKKNNSSKVIIKKQTPMLQVR